MSVTVSSAPRASFQPEPSGTDFEASCRWPLLCLFGSAGLWFFCALLLGLIDSLKFHNPHFLADCSFLTYGRVKAANDTALLYGFGVQAGLGVGLWLLCRLGRTAMAAPWVAVIGTILWNTAVTIGICGILCGDATSYDSFQMPRYAAAILFSGYVLVALCGMVTFHWREPGPLYPSQWFVLGAFFWFAWIFSTASMLLLCLPVRGVMQAAVAWWYAHNFTTVFLAFAGLAPIFYFIPKLLGRPLHSAYLAVLAFYGLAFFGSWGGIPQGAPLPSWIISMGVVGTVLTAVPILAVIANFYHTSREELDSLDTHPTLQFCYFGLVFWLVASVQQIVGALPDVAALTDFTSFTTAQKNLFCEGFFALTMYGSIYYILPRVLYPSDAPVWSPVLVKTNFWLTFLGVLISYLALLVGGIGQGYALNDPRYSFVQVMRSAMVPLRASTLGDLLLLVGAIAFLLNFAQLLSQCGYRHWQQNFVRPKETR